MRWFFLLVPVAAFLGAGCARIPITEDSLFIPRPSITIDDLRDEGLGVANVFFRAEDGARLNAWYVRQPDASATVLFFGGNGFYLVQAGEYLKALARFGVNLFAMDYRGYGRSEGSPSAERVKTDGLRAWDELTARYGVAPESIVVHGHSLGTFPATYVSANRKVAALVLENPATTPRDVFRYAVPWYLRSVIRFDMAPELRGESNLTLISQVTVPTAFVAGEEDGVTVPRMAEELYETSGAEEKHLLIIDGGGHNGLYLEPEFSQVYREILGVAGQSAAASQPLSAGPVAVESLQAR
jgi:pimeloyl-ACP methyl ester carboxylesterase